MELNLEEVWSGGQTGSDLAGLIAARELGIKTGGWMPSGWLTEIGPRPTFEKRFGMKQTLQHGYPHRTFANARDTDATIWFGDIKSRGGHLTVDACQQYKKQIFINHWKPGLPLFVDSEQLGLFLGSTGAKRINFAGNRESTSPGIFYAAYHYFTNSLKVLLNA